MTPTRVPAYDLLVGDVISFYGFHVVRDVRSRTSADGSRVIELTLEHTTSGERHEEVLPQAKTVGLLEPADG